VVEIRISHPKRFPFRRGLPVANRLAVLRAAPRISPSHIQHRLLITALDAFAYLGMATVDEEEKFLIVLRLISVTLGQLSICCVVTLVTFSYIGESEAQAPADL
jgi:hypothetical protein